MGFLQVSLVPYASKPTKRLSVSAIVSSWLPVLAISVTNSMGLEKQLDKSDKPRGNHGVRVLPQKE
jgi:hypothetical protein